MKTRVTFRVDPGLARRLRGLPNQTRFVEEVLREALAQRCPSCAGSGRLDPRRLRISDFRVASLPRLDRDAALRLKDLVRLGRLAPATDLEISADESGAFEYRLARDDEVLLRGQLASPASSVH